MLNSSGGEVLHVGHQIEAAHLGGEEAFRADDLEAAAGVGNPLGRRHAGMSAVVIEEQHVFGRLHVAGEDVPARNGKFGSFLDGFIARQAAGRNEDHIGFECEDVRCLRDRVVAHVDAKALALCHPPVDDADQLAATRQLGGEPDLSASLRCRLEKDDLVAAFGRHSRRFKPGGTRSDNSNPAPRPGGSRDDMRDRGFASGGRIVDAERLMPFIDAIEAVGGADTGPNLAFAALGDLPHDMRIGDMGARHPHHVELALGNGMTRRCHIVDARSMEDRKARGGPYLARKVEMGRGLHARHRYDIGEGCVVFDVALDDVEEVDETRVLQLVTDGDAIGPAEAACPNPRRRPAGIPPGSRDRPPCGQLRGCGR